MQVKKFEAPTIQEALDTIKRELGPEAIILQTKQYKRGFGLMSKASVEVTAAVSDRSLQKKQFVETRLPAPSQDAVKKLPAEKQASLYEKYVEKHLNRAGRVQDQVEVSGKPITGRRYVDIPDRAEAEAPVAKPRVRTAAKSPPTRSPEPVRVEPPRTPRMGVGAEVAPFEAGLSVEEEVRYLKRMIEELKSAQDHSQEEREGQSGSGAQALLQTGSFATPALQDAFEQLVVNGVDKRFALPLIKRVGFELGETQARNPEDVLDQLAVEIMESTMVSSPLGGLDAREKRERPAVIALVGPTGVGKTTTVAKLASEALLRRNLKVGLINLDCYKIAAFDQLGTYAKILNVPFRSVNTAEELKAALLDFKSLDLVLVDTTGRSQRDPDSLKEMRAVLDSVPGLQTQLVLSVTTRDSELFDMASRFAIFRPLGITVSKLDEGTTYGAVYNVSQKSKLPLLYFTTGQRVPEDIEEATPERVAALILDI